MYYQLFMHVMIKEKYTFVLCCAWFAYFKNKIIKKSFYSLHIYSVFAFQLFHYNKVHVPLFSKVMWYHANTLENIDIL